MQHTGTIVAINRRRGMFVVQIDDGDFAVFELLAGIDIAVGDRLQGDLHALGGEDLLHLGQGELFSAFGQSGPSSLQVCRRLIA